MKESIFQRELINSFKKEFGELCWIDKIPDSFNMDRFAPKKPFDIISQLNGQGIAIECKMMRTKSPFPFKEIKPHQLEGLRNYFNARGVSYLIINYRGKDKTKKRFNFAVVIDYFTLTTLMQEYLKSIPYDVIKIYPRIYWDKKEKIWKVSNLTWRRYN